MAYGLLLGLLVVFAVGHYSDSRNQAEAESTSLVALYDALGVYPPETRQTVRHNIVCYMRSIVSDDWPSMEDGNSTRRSPSCARAPTPRPCDRAATYPRSSSARIGCRDP